jgi:hypothetical protein
MKTTTIVVMTICLMSFSLAYYPGETHIFPNDMGIDNLVYTIIGNSSPVSPLEITINSSNITITFPGDMANDTFDIIFLEQPTLEVVKTIHSGGGSSRTRYIDKNVTLYIPEYINTTEEIEVEKIIDNTTVIETGYKLWMVLLGIGIGLVFGYYTKKYYNSDNEKTN